MLEIDGGDGGGQLLRSALALAAVTDRSVRVTDIRGNRPDPGLKPQHLTAVETITEICNGTVEGATAGSEMVEFEPGSPSGGHVTTSVGTAGSLTLLFDTILPLAVAVDQPLSVTASGGTEVKWSPPLAVHKRVKLPLCRRFGLQATTERHQTGFYPAGGGRATLFLSPSSLTTFELTERGELVGARLYSRASHDLAGSEVAQRQAQTASIELAEAGIKTLEQHAISADTQSTGSSIAIELEYEESKAAFDALGEPGKPAETVADEAVETAVAFHKSDAAVDRHLADQLLIFLALAGGTVRVPAITDHIETSLALLEQFDMPVTVSESHPPVVSREH